MSQLLPHERSAVSRLVVGGGVPLGTGAANQHVWIIARGDDPLMREYYNGFNADRARRGDIGLIYNNALSDSAGFPTILAPKLEIHGNSQGGARQAELNLANSFTPVFDEMKIAQTLYFCNNEDASGFEFAARIEAYIETVALGAEFGRTDFKNDVNGTEIVCLKTGSITNFRALTKELAADPVAGDLEAGWWGVFKNTTSAAVFIAMNDGGTIKKVALV